MLTLLYKLKLSKQLGLIIFMPSVFILAIIGIYGLSFGTEFMLVISLLLCAYLIIGSIIIKRTTKKLYQVNEALKALSEGKIPKDQKIEEKDEFSQTSLHITNIGKGLQRASDFVFDLGKGNFSVEYKLMSQEDALGNSLLNLKDGWMSIKNEEAKNTWATESLAKFADLLHQNTHLQKLSNHIIKYLVEILHANQGAIFILDDENQQEQVLELQGCYAFKRTKSLSKKILVGEGLVGQAFLEAETTYLKEVPDDFVLITSGMGDSRPRNILITPLKKEKVVIGVLEIASFRLFEAHEIDFVEKLGENIAQAIISIKSNAHTKRLLKDSQEQASQLQAQEEELRQNQEELQATQEEISRKYKTLFDQLTELNYKAKFEQLKSINATKKRNIEYYFDIIRSQVLIFSEDRMIVEALKEFKAAFYTYGKNLSNNEVTTAADNLKRYYDEEFIPRLDDGSDLTPKLEDYLPKEARTILLQDAFIAGNPYPVGKKQLLEEINDHCEYSKVHKKYHNLLLNFLEKFGYYDIFLIDSETGYMLYSVFKEVDFATNLLEGEYSKTNFGEVVRESLSNEDYDFVKLIDFQQYAPSYGSPASFIASPIYDQGEKIGILVFQMPINKINQILTGDYNWKNDGLGESGETYIVGADHTLRSISRELVENKKNYISSLQKIGYSENLLKKIKKTDTSILIEEVKQKSVDKALEGESGTSLEFNNHGVKTLNAFSPLQIQDVNWIIMSSSREDETSSMLNALRQENSSG